LTAPIPHLTSRDPATFWTSGQWMTESTGGSDVGLSETVARQEDGVWRLYGRKWFTSATTSPMTLTLARPEGNPGGGRGLALFYLELRDEAESCKPSKSPA
jgi:acyl-CoA dehydrogenase